MNPTLLDAIRRALPNDGRLTHLSDPGHGWLVVPKALAADVLQPIAVSLGMAAWPALVSGYSYEVTLPEGPVLLLEEDCDASMFIVALKRQSPAFPNLKPSVIRSADVPNGCEVRTLPRFLSPAYASDKAWAFLSSYARAA